MNVLFIWYKNFWQQIISFCHRGRDWQTNGRTERKTTEIPCVFIHGRTVKILWCPALLMAASGLGSAVLAKSSRHSRLLHQCHPSWAKFSSTKWSCCCFFGEQRQWIAMTSDGRRTASTNETMIAAYVVPDQRSPEGLVSAVLDSISYCYIDNKWNSPIV